MDLWIASPLIFFAGFILLYSKWVIARVAGLCIVGGALAIASSPGDVDNWYLAIILAVIGAIIFVIFRPRWIVHPAPMQTGSRWQFTLRQLQIAMIVFGVCLSFLIVVFRHLREESDVARVVDPILQNYASTVALKDGDVVWLSMNRLRPSDDVGLETLSQRGYTQFYSATENARQGTKNFGDLDLLNIVSEHRALRVLDLRQTEVTDRGLVHLNELAELEWLWLDHSQCTGVGLANLEGLAGLRELMIDDNAASKEDLTRLRSALPNCRIRETPLREQNFSTEEPYR